MSGHNAIDRNKMLIDVRREISKGNNTLALMSHSLKMNIRTLRQQLAWLVMEGAISCKTVAKINYYSSGEICAHDPFNLTGRAYGHQAA